MKRFFFFFIVALMAAAPFQSNAQDEKPGPLVIIETDFGTIKVKLYDETPKHRDNFIKLVNEGFYHDLLFHRVIKDFMIQAGDPDSKNAVAGQRLGNGGPGYTVEAEFRDQFFHKKGALSAARQGDNVNPNKRSSGSQFYIVHGRKFSDAELTMFEERVNQQNELQVYFTYLRKPENKALAQQWNAAAQSNNQEALNKLKALIKPHIEAELAEIKEFKFTPEARQAYTTLGGAPHLDGGYTVFGEVVEGLEVIDKIANVETDKADRPIKDIKMRARVEKK